MNDYFFDKKNRIYIFLFVFKNKNQTLELLMKTLITYTMLFNGTKNNRKLK